MVFLGVVLGPLVIATAVGLLKGYRDSLHEQQLMELKAEARLRSRVTSPPPATTNTLDPRGKDPV